MITDITRHEVINNIIDKKKFEWYLEIGSADLLTFNKIFCKFKVGCDPAYPPIETENFVIYQMTSDNFFDKQKAKYDICFVDGMHLYEQAVKDIVNAWNALHEGGFLIMHDCFPCTADAAERVYRGPEYPWNGDVYRAILWFKDLYPDIYCHVLDTDYGLGIIYKADNVILPNEFPNLLSYMDYDYFWLLDNLDRIGFMRLKDFEAWIGEEKHD